MLWLYSFITWAMQPLVRRKLRRRALAEPGYAENIPERFGFYSCPRTVDAPYIWIHAVSLGETRAAIPLIAELRNALPGMRLLLTHGTATGREQGKALLREGDVQVWQPWDSAGAVQRFLAHFRPRIGLLMETEVWPNLVAQCKAQGIPLCLVNARLNEKSLKNALRVGWLARPAFSGLHAVWAQSQADANRLRQLGAPVQGVFGNFKFDATPDADQVKRGRAWRQALDKPVLVFANSRDGEEAQFLAALKQCQVLGRIATAQAAMKDVANQSNHLVQWMIVPRHPQRFDEVKNLCRAHGFTVSRRSQWQDGLPQAADIWLGDSMGEMALYYALADVALLGGSFAPLGGHNLIEATACECPVLMGPHTFNFAQAAELAMAAGAAFAQPDMQAAVARAYALLETPVDLAQARTAARDLGNAHRGAARHTALAVQQVLSAFPKK